MKQLRIFKLNKSQFNQIKIFIKKLKELEEPTLWQCWLVLVQSELQLLYRKAKNLSLLIQLQRVKLQKLQKKIPKKQKFQRRLQLKWKLNLRLMLLHQLREHQLMRFSHIGSLVKTGIDIPVFQIKWVDYGLEEAQKLIEKLPINLQENSELSIKTKESIGLMIEMVFSHMFCSPTNSLEIFSEEMQNHLATMVELLKP